MSNASDDKHSFHLLTGAFELHVFRLGINYLGEFINTNWIEQYNHLKLFKRYSQVYLDAFTSLRRPWRCLSRRTLFLPRTQFAGPIKAPTVNLLIYREKQLHPAVVPFTLRLQLAERFPLEPTRHCLLSVLALPTVHSVLPIENTARSVEAIHK